MAGDQLLFRIKLGVGHAPTGKTRHFRDGVLCPAPVELRIVRFEADAGVFLLYCDDRGEALTDTWHRHVDDAMNQAQYEFSVKPHEWSC